jgi:hypothetical protein
METEKNIIDEMINSLKKLDSDITFKEFIENHIQNTKDLIYLNGNKNIKENYDLLVKLKNDFEKKLYETNVN